MNSIFFLDVKDALWIHEFAVNEFGGLAGVRDRKLLESAMHTPQVTLFGEFACKDIFEMAACYCFHIIKNHPFVDGNKRTGVFISTAFLEKNGYKIKPNADLYSLALEVAASKISKEQISQFFRKYTTLVK